MILNESVNFLKSRNLECWNFLDHEKERPMVFCWMSAVSIYFNDPEGHELEFIGVLPETKSDKEKRVVTYEEWLKILDE